MERWSLNEAPSWSCPPLAIANQYHDQRSQPQNVRYRLILVRASDFDWLQKDQHYLRHLHQIAAAGHNWIPVQNLPFDELILFAYAADRTPDLRMYWGGPPLGVQNLYTFPTPKSSIKQIEQFDIARTPQESARCARCCFEIFEIFSFSRADKAFEIFEVFEVFSLLCNLQDEPRFWDFWGFQFQSHWQDVWDFFVQRGLGIL